MENGEEEFHRLQQLIWRSPSELHDGNQCWPGAAGLFCIFMKLLISRQENVQ